MFQTGRESPVLFAFRIDELVERFYIRSRKTCLGR